MKVEKFLSKNGILGISIYGIEGNKHVVRKCIDIIKKNSKHKNIFFNLNREEGAYLTGDELIKYRENIPRYLKEIGEYESLYDDNKKISERRKKKGVFDPAIHLIASLQNKDESFRIIYEMLGYYLEIIMFSSDIDWATYKNMISDNTKLSAKFLFENNVTDFVFIYRENNDFEIFFDQNKYDGELIYNNILKILDSEIEMA